MYIFSVDNILKFGELLASFTGFFVAWLVFKIQAITYEAQITVTALEQKKFLYTIRPEFKLIIDRPDANGWLPENTINTNYQLELIKNVALEFYIVNTGAIKSPDFDNRKLSYVGMGRPFPILPDRSPISIVTDEYYAEIFFTDEIGSQYKQIIRGNIQDLQISPPITVGDRKLNFNNNKT